MGGGSSCITAHGGGQCKGSFFPNNPQYGSQAVFCADEGDYCKAEGGPATVYYGGAMSWYKITLQDGESIKCDHNGWKQSSSQQCGCEPFIGDQWCFKFQEITPVFDTRMCCGGTDPYRGTTIDDFVAADQHDMFSTLVSYVQANEAEYEDAMASNPEPFNSVEGIAVGIAESICVSGSCPGDDDAVWPVTSPGCVLGHNLILYSDQTVAECQYLCAEYAQCVGFEYGVDHGGASTAYQPKDCQLQSSADQTGCDGAHYNLDFYTRTDVYNAQSVNALDDFNFYESEPVNVEPNYAFTIDAKEVMPMALALLALVNVVCLCYWCAQKCFSKKYAKKQYGKVVQFEAESEADPEDRRLVN